MYKSIAIACIIAISTSVYSQNSDFDKKIGAEYSEQIEDEMGLFEHESMTLVVNKIGDELVENIIERKFDYNFAIVDMGAPNAFALPGGYVYVSRGILALMNTKDDLAGVMGHEIGHCELRHSIKQMRRKIIPAILRLPGQIVALTVDEHLGKMINAPLSTGSGLFMAQYSRKHEKQADKYGLDLMARTGYAAHHFPSILNRLSVLVKVLTGSDEEFSYFDSHPYTPKRVEYLKEEIVKHSLDGNEDSIREANEFIKALDGLYFGKNPDHGIFNKNEFSHPLLGIHVTFPEGWLSDVQPGVFGAADTVNNESVIVVGVLPETRDPKVSGDEYAKKIFDKYKVPPHETKAIDLDGISAYAVSMMDSSEGKVIGIYNIWFNINGKSYHFIGMGPDSDLLKIQNTALSIRRLANNEIALIQTNRIRIVEAKEGEDLESLCERVENVIKPEIIAILNDVDKDAKLKERQLVKVVIEENYLK